MGIENDTEFEALCARLLPKFNEYLQRHSKNIFSCELATSLDGISTMPALYSKDGVQKQVIAPLSLLTKDVDIRIEEAKQATEEAKQATEEANTAAGKANDAAASVNKATTDLTAERKKVEDAVSASKSQTEAAKQATEATLSSKAAIESNEAKRQAAEQTRQSQEQARMDSEIKRATAENARIAAEAGRVTAENKRIDDTLTALTESEKQTNLAQELNDHPPKMGDNGNWWQWDLSKHTYVDTGVIARGGAMYPAFRQRRNKLLMIDYGSHVAEHVVKRRNKLVIKV
jgi:DNA polymerase III gamma/tau subunit